MSRRKRERQKQNGERTREQEIVVDQPWTSPTSRSNKWLLAGAVLLQATWTAFLILMVVAG